jgi:DNA-binding HxlR family transcriptional regulator
MASTPSKPQRELDALQAALNTRPLSPEDRARYQTKLDSFKGDITRVSTIIHGALRRQIAASRSAEVQPMECTSYRTLLGILEQDLHVDETWADVFACLLAITISPKVLGPMLWTFLIGESGSGKTTMLDLIAQSSSHVYSLDRFNGFFSGIGKGSGSDIVDSANGRCLGIKDFTAMLSNPGRLEEVLGQFRGIYDGHADVAFLTGKVINLRDVRFSFIGCSTPVIRRCNDSLLGARFLSIDMGTRMNPDGSFDWRKINRMELVRSGLETLVAQLVDGIEAEASPAGKAATWGFLETISAKLEDPSTVARITERLNKQVFIDWISALGQWTEAARTVVDLSTDKLQQEPGTGTRLAKVFMILSILLTLIFETDGDKSSDEILVKIRNILKKVSYDTAFGWYLDVMIHLAAHPNTVRTELRAAIGASSETQLNRILEGLLALGIITKTRSSPSGMGQPPYLLSLSEEFHNYAFILGLTNEKQIPAPIVTDATDGPTRTTVPGARLRPRPDASEGTESSGQPTRRLPSFTRRLARGTTPDADAKQ